MSDLLELCKCLCDVHFLCTQSADACCTPALFAGGLASAAKGWQFDADSAGWLVLGNHVLAMSCECMHRAIRQVCCAHGTGDACALIC